VVHRFRDRCAFTGPLDNRVVISAYRLLDSSSYASNITVDSFNLLTLLAGSIWNQSEIMMDSGHFDSSSKRSQSERLAVLTRMYLAASSLRFNSETRDDLDWQTANKQAQVVCFHWWMHIVDAEHSFLQHTVNCGRFCFWCRQSVFCLCMKYLGNRWTNLRQIHTEDMLGPYLGQVWRSRSKSPGTKKAFFDLFGGLRVVYVW